MIDRLTKRVLLASYEILLDHKEFIINLPEDSFTRIDDVWFNPEEGVCAFAGRYLHSRECYWTGGFKYIMEMNQRLYGDKGFPIPDEDYHASGNKYKLDNPTHNAVVRWEYIEKCINYIRNDLENTL